MVGYTGSEMAVAAFVAVLAFALAALAALVITPRVARFATRRSYHVLPSDDRRIHERPTPWLGGAAVVAATLVSAVIVGILVADLGALIGHERRLVGLFAGAGVLFVVGLADDFIEFQAKWTLVAQLVAAASVVSAGTLIETVTLGGEASYELGMLAIPVTVVWIVGVTNAFNLIDGLDGLAAGLGFIALGATAIGAALLGNVAILALSAALAGALLGFLRYNYNPARIFLGNAGSFVVGFLLAVLSVQGSVAGDDAGMLILVPLFALALPLLDTSLAIARRWLRGAPIFTGDARHVHHRLLHIGLSQRSAVHVLWLTAAGFAALGLLVAFAPEPVNGVAAVVGGSASVLALVWALRRLEYSEIRIALRLLTMAPFSLRRAVQDQIYAEDMVEPLGLSSTLSDVNALLADSANRFGFQRLVVRRERDRWLDASESKEDREFEQDFPIASTATRLDSLVLHISRSGEELARPYSTEQVAGILVPAIERWASQNAHLLAGTSEAVPSDARPGRLGPVRSSGDRPGPSDQSRAG